ncbi:predicted protein [Uncinocarpus reesii 1704]|uniref:UNC-45/Cro1/She4 central domain-containing protein n=1 Tax=Uncinocarpus reesii (strain UAMH 1704) TaxID=336963 RepID=C4JRX1_UNCRE|nr:uncharacterized protein UREG_05210 [Uncinocarpus reesii 1704]EEP80368.1 predicted protein [Uncinocarpus reesii 1704]
MVSVINNDRAAFLAKEAVDLVDAGHREAASRNLREAISLSPESSEVKAAFLKVNQDEQNNHPLLSLCRRYVNQQDEAAGKEAARYLRQEGLEPPADVALESLKLVLGTPASKLSAIQDDIISGLARQTVCCRQYFAAELQNSVTQFFDELYDRGDGSVVCLDMIITSAIRPLLLLLTPPETGSVDQPRDFLPIFEGLLALTNLASSPDRNAGATIVRAGWSTIEDLLLSNHSYIQRAACELACNLMTCEQGVGKFADGSARASQRLHIILALADVEDLPTRRAAGGALAMLTEYESAVSAILDRARGLEIILGLCGDEDDGLVHRGIVCVQNLVRATGDIGKRARQGLLENGALDTLKTCLTKTRNPAVVEGGVEAVKALIT